MRHFTTLPSTLLALVLAVTVALASAQPEGVQIDTTKAATCDRPSQKNDIIRVNYRGKLESGKEFDNSYDRGQPFEFKLGANQVIKGWDIAILGMCPGEGRRLTIPPELAYGNRQVGPIPPESTLIFDTELVEIVGVEQHTSASTAANASSGATSGSSSSAPASTTSEETMTIATAPPKPAHEEEDEKAPDAVPTQQGSDGGPLEEGEKPHKRCQLLGPFALIVQGALGGFAILTLVWKRYRESPQRPWRIWFFDVSKQVFGSMLTHVLNVGMSMLSSVALANHAEKFASQAQAQDEQGRYPNPCSFYLLNLAIDTTLGIPVLYVLLIVVHALCLRTPLARPPQSLQSGNYGEPPKTSWYLKQLLIYFIGLTGMKFTVFLLFSALPWLPWVGDWALRWTQGNEKLEIAFAMFIFPLLMNAIQYYVIDNLIMDKKKDKIGYQAVEEEDGFAEEERLVHENDIDEDERFKLDDEDEEPLKDDPIATGGYSSSSQSTLKGDDNGKKSK